MQPQPRSGAPGTRAEVVNQAVYTSEQSNNVTALTNSIAPRSHGSLSCPSDAAVVAISDSVSARPGSATDWVGGVAGIANAGPENAEKALSVPTASTVLSRRRSSIIREMRTGVRLQVVSSSCWCGKVGLGVAHMFMKVPMYPDTSCRRTRVRLRGVVQAFDTHRIFVQDDISHV